MHLRSHFKTALILVSFPVVACRGGELSIGDEPVGGSGGGFGIPDENLVLFNPPGSEPICGDGLVGTTEPCDDGSQQGQDGCSADCQVEQGFICVTPGDGGPSLCSDVDECEGEPLCGPSADCVNTLGSFACACEPGYAGDGITCVDIDECASHLNNCDDVASCVNTPGSFECSCPAGYVGDGTVCVDADECDGEEHGCDAHAVCIDTDGSYSCACWGGYEGDGTECTDIDECESGDAFCDVNALCTNTVGHFSCECNPGWQGDGVSCVDIDECAAGTDACAEHATCENTLGSYTCTCEDGYQGDGSVCVDADECADDVSPCDANAACINQSGDFACACLPGYSGDGFECSDVNECAVEACGAHTSCTNTDGGFGCECLPGFERNLASGECENVDECALDRDDCGEHASCFDTVGGFMCACLPGFTGNGLQCSDVDECVVAGVCAVGESCSNTLGGFSCEASCELSVCGAGADACVDLHTSHSNCGECGHACLADQTCMDGLCFNPDGCMFCHTNAGGGRKMTPTVNFKELFHAPVVLPH